MRYSSASRSMRITGSFMFSVMSAMITINPPIVRCPMSRYDDLFDLLEENNDLAQEILEYQRKLEKKFEEVLALLKKQKETL